MSTPQAQAAEGLCLKFPHDIGLHREINIQQATAMLSQALAKAAQVPFQWGFIDQPREGQVFLIFLPSQTPFPNDGIRYLEAEQKGAVPLDEGKELEIYETKYGFIPQSSDPNAWRVRRRYRLLKGGHPQLMLIHYTRGPHTPITPSLINQPIRTYPLRNVQEASVYVAGPQVGMKVPHPARPGPPGPGPGPGPVGGMNMGINLHQQQAMLAQQNTNMEILERKRREQTARQPVPPPRVEEIEDVDDTEFITSRALALARYRRNHDFMNDVFRHAAYRGKHTPAPPKPYSIFNLKELEEKTAKLEAEVEALKSRTGIRRSAAIESS